MRDTKEYSYLGNDNDVDKADGMNWSINAEGKGYRQRAERKSLRQSSCEPACISIWNFHGNKKIENTVVATEFKGKGFIDGRRMMPKHPLFPFLPLCKLRLLKFYEYTSTCTYTLQCFTSFFQM